MSKPLPLPLPPLTLKGITSVFRLKPLDELDNFLMQIRKRKFSEALAQLQPEPEESMARLVAKYAKSNPPRQEPLLHWILERQPPTNLFALVWKATNAYMGDEVTPDESLNSRKQTPLHVACFSQCNLDIVRELLNGRSGMIPTVIRDEDGRFPMHLLFLSEQLGSLSQVMETVNMLLDCECYVAHMADSYGRTPLDYARYKRVNDRIIDQLLEARMHLNDDDHEARLPSELLDGSESSVAIVAVPIPSFIEFDANSSDDVSVLEMTDIRAKHKLEYGWEDTDEELDDYIAAPPANKANEGEAGSD